VPNDEGHATTSAELRAHNLARLLRAVHDGGGQQTRAELTRQLGLARGTATVLVRELAGRRLITELAPPDPPSAQRARGRPTGVPSVNSGGPVALAVDLRDDSFTTAVFELTGRGTVLDSQERGTRDGRRFLAHVAATLRKHRHALDGRVVGTGVAVPSPVSAGRMVQPTLDDWKDVDIAHALQASVGNDARLAGLAEARRGVLRGVPVALHLHAATGIGGVLLTGGQLATGAQGSAGEFGHMPLTGGDAPCRCGAFGCWELYAGARGLLRGAGLPSEQGDRLAIATSVIGADPHALGQVADALGRGIGALVNAHDPAAVSLSGLAASVLAAAPALVSASYLAALMRFRRASPPALLPSALGDLGPLTGAAELVFDGFLTARGLAEWARDSE
jgi:predicted NBD/HSP70 family sugar kinase